MLRALIPGAALILVLGANQAKSQSKTDPFDPKGFLQQKAAATAKGAEALKSRGIYKINGQRFHQFVSDDGVVFLPGAGSMPDMHEEFAICQTHLGLMNEVLPMREGLPVDAEAKKVEKQIIGMIRKCQEGKMRSPVKFVETRDGAVIEVKAKPAPGDTTQHPVEGVQAGVGTKTGDAP